MNRMNYKKIIILFSVIQLTACSSADSDDIKTSGISASFSVNAIADGKSHLRARLGVGGSLSNTDLELENGDQLVVSANGQSLVMREDKEFLGGFEYKATLPFNTENTEFTFSFNRPDGDSAPDSTVIMPAAVNLASPTMNSVFNRTDLITISWTPVSYNMTSISIDFDLNDCADATGQVSSTGMSSGYDYNSSSDPGSVFLTASALFSDAALQNLTLSCKVNILVTRHRKGVVDPTFGEGGSINAYTSDSVVILINP